MMGNTSARNASCRTALLSRPRSGRLRRAVLQSKGMVMTMNTGQQSLDTLNAKVLATLGDRVILKPLTRWNEAYKEFPRYVMEYLVSRYVQPADPVAGQEKIDRILTEQYAESAKKELIKSRIKEKGQYTLLGQFSVRLDQAQRPLLGRCASPGRQHRPHRSSAREEHGDILLTSGAWGTMEIEYDGTYEIKGKKYPFYVDPSRPCNTPAWTLTTSIARCRRVHRRRMDRFAHTVDRLQSCEL